MDIAIITGASSGLGVEFLSAIIEKYNTLDEIWIIARREERLKELSSKYKKIVVRPIALDLAQSESYESLEETLNDKKPKIQVLINNAGVERFGRLDEMSAFDIQNMIQLNAIGMTMINRICLPYMSAGSIEVITCSVSSFTPVPSQAVYSATKAYVRYFARALQKEMMKKNVSILILCPGNMDTEMNSKSSPNTDKIAKLPYLDMKLITRRSLEKATKGKKIYTPGTFYKMYRILSKILPSTWMMHFSGGYYDY